MANHQFLGVLKLALGLTSSTLISSIALAADVTPAPSEASGWTFTVEPYMWLAGIDGTVAALGGPPVDIDASISDVLSALDIGLMGVGQARNGRFSIAGDAFWVKLGDEGGTPRQVLADKYDLTINNLMLTGVAGYSLIYQDGVNFDLVGGARLWSIENDLTLKGGLVGKASFDQTETWIDPVVGFKGSAELGSNFFVTGWALAGGFGVSSKFMWDVQGSIGYQFNDWSSATLGFRALGVDYENGGFEYDVMQAGPMMGAVFHF